MSKIIAFEVPTKEMGLEAIDQLHESPNVADAALVYKTDKGHVRVQQTSAITAGKGAVRGGILGAVVSIFSGPFLGVTAAGAAAGAAFGALRDKGIDDKVMKLAGEQLEEGGAAVFVLADDDVADLIASEVEIESGGEIEVSDFPAEAQKVVREALKLED